MKTPILLIFFLFFTGIVHTQIVHENRIEFNIDEDFKTKKVEQFGSSGFLLISQKESLSEKEIIITYTLFNVDLESQKSTSLTINRKYFPARTYGPERQDFACKDQGILHSLYYNTKGHYTIVNISSSTLQVSKVTGIFPKKSTVQDMKIKGDLIFFHIKTRKKNILLSVNWKTGVQKRIPVNVENFKDKEWFIKSIQVLNPSKEIFVYLNHKLSKDKAEFLILKLNDRGEIESYFNFSTKVTQNIIHLTAAKINDEDYLFTGTYSDKQTIKDNLSTGIFYAHVSREEVKFIKFYNYLDLSKFITYYSRKERKIISRLINRDKAAGKKLKLYYSLTNHDLRLMKDGCIFIGEIYVPTTRNEPIQISYLNTSGVPSNSFSENDVFDGYRYTHAIIVKFDKSGNLIWDNNFRMESEYKPFFEEQLVAVVKQNDKSINMVFGKDDVLVSKSVNQKNGRIVQYEAVSKIQNIFEGDIAEKSVLKVEYWYDNFFIVYGTQSIKNKKDRRAKRKRNVFFINKIEYIRPETYN